MVKIIFLHYIINKFIIYKIILYQKLRVVNFLFNFELGSHSY